MDIENILIVLSAISSPIALWVGWHIKSQREKQKHRRELLANVRSLLANPPPKEEFRQLPIYFQVKPFLSVTTIKTVDGEFDRHGNEFLVIAVGRYGGLNPYAHEVLTDISRLEQEWKLL